VAKIKANQIRSYSVYLKEIDKDITDESNLKSYKTMLLDYMLSCNNENISDYYVKVLFELCCLIRSDLLSDKQLLARLPFDVAVNNLNILYGHQQYNSIALLRYLNGQVEDAIDIWKQ
jgi:hypothetical protein